MCGRYSLGATGGQIADRFAAVDRTGGWSPRWNCKPTTSLPIIRLEGGSDSSDIGHAATDFAVSLVGKPVLHLAKWGWQRQFGPESVKPTLLINAVGEEVPMKKTFKEAYRSRRCLVPASSYFEWLPKSKTSPARPFVFGRRDGDLIAIAGLWEEVDVGDAYPEVRFVLLTMNANPVVVPVHHRMAAVLLPSGEDRWLDPSSTPEVLDAALHALPDDALHTFEVGREVGFTEGNAVEGPQLIAPLLVTAEPAAALPARSTKPRASRTARKHDA